MRQDILSKLNRLFSGTIDTIKVTCRTSKLQETMKFEMLGHEITEDGNAIKVSDGTGNGFFSPKTVAIDPTEVKNVTYEDDKGDGSGIHCRKVVIMMKDGNRIELETVAFG